MGGEIVYTSSTVKMGARGLFFKPTRSDLQQNNNSGNLLKAPRHFETATPAPILTDSVGPQSMNGAGFCVLGGVMVKAIQTRYGGYFFRSRLEARWAVYFDALGLDWVYEPEGYEIKGGYLPDFYLPALGCFTEVKPRQFSQIEFEKCAGLPKPCLLLDTPTPETYRGYYITDIFEWSSYRNYLHSDDYGRILIPASQSRGRLWFLLGERPENYTFNLQPEISAKSARFEHGAGND